jgi:hypothetical protein
MLAGFGIAKDRRETILGIRQGVPESATVVGEIARRSGGAVDSTSLARGSTFWMAARR